MAFDLSGLLGGLLDITLPQVIMVIAGLVLLYLGIAKEYEPTLLIPIGFGCILANLPVAANMIGEDGLLGILKKIGVDNELFPLLIFLGVGAAVFLILPWLTPRFFRMYGGRPSELETKFLLLCLLGMGALATWADSEAVLPAYLIGMVLAGTVGKDHALVRRLRTLTFGLLTPFYFIRAGSFVSIPALVAAPAAFVFFLVVKIGTKIIGVYPVTKFFGSPNKEAMYTTLLMSTGLTFGTISSLFGLSHGIIDQGQYSALVATVIASAVIPTVVANAFYLPRHLLPEPEAEEKPGERRAVTPLRQAARTAD